MGTDDEIKDTFIKIFQAASELYAEFLEKLIDAVWKHVTSKKIQQLLPKLLTFENANEKYPAILCAIRERRCNVISTCL